MEARALTLVEVVAVLAILVVVTALALPAVQTRLDESRFDAAERGVEAAIVMARAEAMRRGAPVSLVGRGIAGGETGLFVEGVRGTEGARGGMREDTGIGTGNRDSRDERPGSSGTPVVVIGSGVKLSATAPAIAEGQESGGAARPAAKSDRASTTVADDVVVARFMPDGTAVTSSAGAVYVVGRGMAAACHVNRWTGSGMVEAIDLTAKAGDGTAPPREEAPAGGSAASKEPAR